MSRLLLIILAYFCMSSITTAAVAHAAEPLGPISKVEAPLMGHTTGDADEVPSDADKGVPHHHGSCHSHHAFDAVSDQQRSVILSQADKHVGIRSTIPLTSTSPPALRPPIA